MNTLSSFWSGAVRFGQSVDFNELFALAGSWSSLYDNALDILRSVGVAEDIALQWISCRPLTTVGIAIPMESESYPDTLRGHPWAPPVLFVLGEQKALSMPSFGIVGTRDCTAYGASVCSRLAGGLASSGFSVVSGLARGIDGHAHRAALKVGVTVAVLAHGLAHTAPRTHERLRSDILTSGGALVSVWPDDVPPRPFRFPQRNRWIAGLSEQLIVVEAGYKSGALITARYAAEIGREVWAVPGRIASASSDGCNRLISEGAGIIWDTQKMLEYWIGSQIAPMQMWMSWLMDGVTLEEVSRRTGRSISELLTQLSQMELEGAVVRLPGQRYGPGRLDFD